MSLQLSSYFSGIGVKKLSQVEVDPSISNQHEFNGIREFRNIKSHGFFAVKLTRQAPLSNMY